MHNFTPLAALIGGVLIGTAASLLLWLDGRIAGISGIAGGLLTKRGEPFAWRVLFLVGLVAGAAVVYFVRGDAPQDRPEFPAWLLAAGSALVGFGTALGSGCTSGHGVCGLGRLSLRSLVATLVFLMTAIATTYVVRHVFAVAT
jgi:uncharacterized membrane protein YedE/YeeE